MTSPTPHRSQPCADAALNLALLDREYIALLAQYGRVQRRCTDALAAQARRITTLETELVRLRASLIIQNTMLAQQRGALEARVPAEPCLPRRTALARQVDALVEHVRELLAERQRRYLRQITISPAVLHNPRGSSTPISWSQSPRRTALKPAGAQNILYLDGSGVENEKALETSLVAADLVICQVACISHNAYWRVQEHCKRTGKTCVLVHPPATKTTPNYLGK